MGLSQAVREAADILFSHDKITIISHIDADGISAEAILASALSRDEHDVRSVFLRQLESTRVSEIPRDDSLKVFSDLGAGQQQLLQDEGFSEDEVLIVDHHVTQPCDIPYFQVNALAFGHNKLSAAGLAYFIARAIDPVNTDLAKVAVVGNVGDMMAREDCGLIGPAREIVDDGISYGNIICSSPELTTYGISTRPLHLFLSYSDDPHIPGISNNQSGAIKFLQRLGIVTGSQKRWPVWEDLLFEERRLVISGLAQQIMASGASLDRLLGEVYLFPDEQTREPVRNASEYATLLNACGRRDAAHTGSSICRGDRAGAYKEAKRLLSHHRSDVGNLLQFILDTGVQDLSHLQFIHVGDRYLDTIVGIGAGMALSRLNRNKPIMVMCAVQGEPTLTKVSMRTNEQMVQQGVDLQLVLATASEEIGGAGGGHRIAAGAYIPTASEEVFKHRVNRLLAAQYAATGQDHR
jgi:RecJ-like exonuclease